MLWWFLILAASFGAVLWAAIAIYLRVRRHMTPTESQPGKDSETEDETDSGMI
jgi:hypothetical protein